LEETEGQPSTGRNEENPEVPHKQKLVKNQKQIRKLKKENKLLKKKAKRAKVLKQKVGKLKGIIKELKKQLELAHKTHKIKKTTRVEYKEGTPFLRKKLVQILWEHKLILRN
jgi:cell shape-determining protein MreC